MRKMKINFNKIKGSKLIGAARSVHHKLKKHYGTIGMFGLVGVLCVLSSDAFALGTTPAPVADQATVLEPIYTKIIGSLSGTFGKILMGIGIGMGGMAGILGMSKVAIATPPCIGLILGNAGTIVSWFF